MISNKIYDSTNGIWPQLNTFLGSESPSTSAVWMDGRRHKKYSDLRLSTSTSQSFSQECASFHEKPPFRFMKHWISRQPAYLLQNLSYLAQSYLKMERVRPLILLHCWYCYLLQIILSLSSETTQQYTDRNSRSLQQSLQ
jgi:hypothetical protein